MQVEKLVPEEAEANLQSALEGLEKVLGLPPLLTAEAVLSGGGGGGRMKKLTITHLATVHNATKERQGTDPGEPGR